MMRPVSTKTAMNAPVSTPPYVRLANRLRSQIRDHALAPGAGIGTEVQLARESGLSRMTVRRAVQVLVDEGLVERRPGRGVFVRGADTATRSVLFLAGNLLWAPAVRVSHALLECAPGEGIDIRLFDARDRLDVFLDEMRGLPNSGHAGAVIMSQHDPAFNRALSTLVAEDVPFVVVDQTLTDIEAPSVVSDNRTGGRLVAEALLAAGHRRIAFVGDLGADTTAERARGVAEACAAAGIPAVPMLDLPGKRFTDWSPDIHRALREVVRSPGRPTAIACSCDAVAATAYRALADEGLRVPDDISITGFDDDPLGEWLVPPLTTVRQDFGEMGRQAFAALCRRIADSSAPAERISVPVALVERNSIAAPPKQRRPAACPIRRPATKASTSHR